MMYLHERHSVLMHLRNMLDVALTTASGGNISLRIRETGHIVISPTGIAYADMTEEDVLVLDANGMRVDGRRLPSSELHMHLAVYRSRPDVCAIVHTHSPYATTFACLREAIPAVHYLVGLAGSKVRVADYATFGTRELAENTVAALGDDNAVLLANHGLLAVGSELQAAFTVAEQIEFVARLYYQSRCIGTPVVLNEEEMKEVFRKFRDYGRQPDARE